MAVLFIMTSDQNLRSNEVSRSSMLLIAGERMIQSFEGDRVLAGVAFVGL
ncbi:hypothetical protein A2U01_0108714 [Trifolium medium]|uniref:Uncharacterized protein n=1 Tax=Trifolium medium TaxID=97028 RepID=A0A392VKC4_9FABA|nr:hypothetical protein [Trifolium medium]